MTVAQLRKYMREWQSRLGLSHWDIKLKVGEIDSSLGAECDRSEFYDEATITVATFAAAANFDDHKPIDDFWWEKTIVHELLHCSMRDVVYAPAVINEALKKPERRALRNAFQRAEEAMVDRLAENLVIAWRTTRTDSC